MNRELVEQSACSSGPWRRGGGEKELDSLPGHAVTSCATLGKSEGVWSKEGASLQKHPPPWNWRVLQHGPVPHGEHPDWFRQPSVLGPLLCFPAQLCLNSARL